VLVGDYDEQRWRVRLRAATTKTRKALWVELHPVLADAIEASLGPREDRDENTRMFEPSGADALRTAIGKACKALGIPPFSPHDLRHRRISLLHLRGMPWARIGEFVGQRNLAVTANTYTHVLVPRRSLDHGRETRVARENLCWPHFQLAGERASARCAVGDQLSVCARTTSFRGSCDPA